MKRILLTLSVFVGLTSFAQMDTLSAHCTSTTLYSGLLDDAAPIDSGFIAGTNMYGDKAKMQLFDAAYGVTGAGTINAIAIPVIAKAGTGTVTFAIWPDNSGEPNYTAPLVSKIVDLANLDTTIASTMPLADGNFYNNVISFDTPIAIPANGKFWAGFTLPAATGLFATAISTPFGGAGATHTGEIWSDDSFVFFGETGVNGWELDASMTIFPIVDFTAGIGENVISASVYPNPANDVLNIKIEGEVAAVNVLSLDGKIVATSSTATVNVADLNAGMYIYQVTTANGQIATGNFAKN